MPNLRFEDMLKKYSYRYKKITSGNNRCLAHVMVREHAL